MTDKAAKIFSLLLNNDKMPLTVKKITGILELSERTVGTYLKEVYQFCAENEIEVINKPGVGISVNAGNRRDELMQMLARIEKPHYGAQYRTGYIIELLLNNWTTYTLSLFADDLGVSKNTVENDLKQVQQWLSRFSISVQKKAGAGIFLTGAELDIRRAIVEINRQFFKKSVKLPRKTLDYRLSLKTYQRLYGCYRNCDVDYYIALIQEADQNTLRDLTDSGFETLLEYLIVMEKRISLGFLVAEDEIEDVPADRPNILNYLSVYVKALKLPKGEQKFLQMVTCCLEYQNSTVRRDELFSQANPGILAFTKRLIAYLSNIVGLDFEKDELLLKSLYMFERSSLVRVRYGIDLQNPFRENIKKTYPAIFSACFAAGGLYEKEVGKFPTENELASLALLVGGAVVRSEKKVTAVIVCSSGFGTSQILARKIGDHLHNIDVLSTLSFSELHKLDLLNPMLVVTTISSLKCDRPTVEISPVLNEDDIHRLKKACLELQAEEGAEGQKITILDILKDDLIFLDVDGKAKEKILRSMTERMEKSGCVIDGFHGDVLRREQMGSTALGQGIAIPHGLSSFVKRPAIALALLNQSIDWGGEAVDIIFLLALNFGDIQNTKAFFKAFYQLTSDGHTMDLLRRARTKNEIKKIIEEHCFE